MMRIISYILLAIVIIVGFSFAYLNANLVMINYFVGSKQLPLSLLIAIGIVVGGLLGLVVTMKKIFRLKRENFRLVKKLKSHEKELNNLRTLPSQHA